MSDPRRAPTPHPRRPAAHGRAPCTRTPRALAACLLTAALLAPRPAPAQDAPAPPEPPLRILLVTGGGWHDYPEQRRILVEGLAQRIHAEVTVDDTGGADSGARIALHDDDAWASAHDLVVYNTCYSEVDDSDRVDRIVRAHVAHRVPAVVLHCAMHSFNYTGANPIWSMFVGVRTHRHERQRPFTIEALAPEHPILARFPHPWRTPQGELYEIAEVFPTATPLAHAFGEDTGRHHVTAWTNRFAGVRVFGTTIGHHNETMAAAPYLDLVAAGLLWAAGALDDAGRPLPGYTPHGGGR